MNKAELKVARINAVLYASEEILERPSIDRGTILMVKEHSYDQIKMIMDGKCPWQEDEE